MHNGLTIIYDGHCPFCSSYVSVLNLRRSVGSVDLVDARSEDPRLADALLNEFDLDDGMVAIWEGRYFHGRDAVHLLAKLSAPTGFWNDLQRRAFASPRRAAAIYPCLAAGRRLFLRLAGRPLIADSTKSSNRGE